MELRMIDRKLIDEISGIPDGPVKPVYHGPVKRLADSYDLRFIGKMEAKRFTYNEIHDLLDYANGYLDLYASGKYMTKLAWDGRVVADFDEDEAVRCIQNSIVVLENELKRRR